MTSSKDSGSEESNGTPDSPRDLTLWETFQSVLWAMLGVQKRSNAKRDFSRGKASHFIVLGILFGVGFVILPIFVVRLVLEHAI